MTEPTGQTVSTFWDYMTHRFGASVVDKNNATEMQLVSALLGALGIVDRAAFMKSFTTTVGRRIYVPFEVGVANQQWSLWGQIMVCAHECQHVIQFNELGSLRFAWQYIGKSAGRTAFEAEAYRCQLELHFWRTGELLSPHELAAKLVNYGVTNADIQVAETALKMSAESVRRGAVINPTSRAAIDWLNIHAPELRAEKS